MEKYIQDMNTVYQAGQRLNMAGGQRSEGTSISAQVSAAPMCSWLYV